MDFGVIANLLLFLGAFGIILFTQLDNEDEDTSDSDPLYDANDYDETRNGTNGDDVETADKDNLAWFLKNGDDDLTGSSTADYANLGDGDDQADMGSGNDIALGEAGNDAIDGAVGNDALYGGTGEDTLSGASGNDGLSGGEDGDILTGGLGVDGVYGGDGNDVLSGYVEGASGVAGQTGPEGADTLAGGNGDDTLLLGRGDTGTGGSGADLVQLDNRWRDTGGVFTVTDFNSDEDQLQLLYHPAYSVDTGAEIPPDITLQPTSDGTGTLVLLNGTVVAELQGVTDLTAEDITLVSDTETDPDYVPSNYDEVQACAPGDDDAEAGDGATAFFTEGGDDTVTGSDEGDYGKLGAGDDSAKGGDGADLVTGGAGADFVAGGAGDDTIGGFIETAGGDESQGTAIDGVDTLQGGDGNDLLLLGQDDSAYGGAGEDSFSLDIRWDRTSGSASIHDYDADLSEITLVYQPEFDAEGAGIPPVVTIVQNLAGGYAAILLNGEQEATVTAAPDLLAAEIRLSAG